MEQIIDILSGLCIAAGIARARAKCTVQTGRQCSVDAPTHCIVLLCRLQTMNHCFEFFG